jgi:GNAT superfamily N-acetyltransferase
MNIGLVQPQQCERLVDLLCEINTYYNSEAPSARELVRQHAVANLMSAASPHHLAVATKQSGELVGLAAVTKAYSLVEPEPERRNHLQLKELFVSETERGQGIGLALMSWVAQFALENQCHRIDWPVKASNVRGQAFYASFGAQLVSDRLNYRLTEPAVSDLANKVGERW